MNYKLMAAVAVLAVLSSAAFGETRARRDTLSDTPTDGRKRKRADESVRVRPQNERQNMLRLRWVILRFVGDRPGYRARVPRETPRIVRRGSVSRHRQPSVKATGASATSWWPP